MKPIYEKTIQIEVTNACNLECANCTRFVGHHRKPFFMDLDTVKTAIKSLDDFPGNIGLMGGEPTLHPQFREICTIYREMIPEKNRRRLWTNGYKWKQYEDDIKATFNDMCIVYNEHADPDEGVHQPLLIAAKDVIDDKAFMWKLIDDCWIQQRWSASITPKGGFFCEVAAAQDLLFDGPGGYPLEKGWSNKTPDQFRDQIERYCENCSAAIPMPRPSAHSDNDGISKTIAAKLQAVNSPRYLKGRIKLFEKRFSEDEIREYAKDWTPWSHRTYKQFGPDIIIK